MRIDDALDDRVRHAYDDTAYEQYSTTFRGETSASLGTTTLVLIGMVCLWSLAESHWEMGSADGSATVFALVIAKFILLCAGAAAIFGPARAGAVFVFICASSVFVVGSALPFEYKISTTLFYLSLVECVLKIAAIASYAIWHFEMP
jgi:hypothetical protein